MERRGKTFLQQILKALIFVRTSFLNRLTFSEIFSKAIKVAYFTKSQTDFQKIIFIAIYVSDTWTTKLLDKIF